MRGYDLKFQYLFKNKWVSHHNTSCWAGLQDLMDDGYKEEIRLDMVKNTIPTDLLTFITVRLINKITPCYIKDGYLYYKIIGDDREYYDRNLFILNFIRYLWNVPDEDKNAYESYALALKKVGTKTP